MVFVEVAHEKCARIRLEACATNRETCRPKGNCHAVEGALGKTGAAHRADTHRVPVANHMVLHFFAHFWCSDPASNRERGGAVNGLGVD